MSASAPRVALESTVIAHGLPFPHNLHLALELEEIVRAHGACPCTVAILGGRLRVGLSESEIGHLATGRQVRKVSRRDLPVVAARGEDGATTVAATLWIAHRAGIQVFATGGIGGVHRGGGWDVSADLPELAQTPLMVVCAGAKAILDLEATLEYLETYGVTVVGFGTETFPAFYSRDSGLPVDVCCESAAEVAAIWRARRQMQLPGAMLVAVPIPQEDEIPAAEIEPIITRALAEASAQGLRSAQVTPFLLSRIAQLSGDRSLRANLALLRQNARVAALIARELAD